VVVPEPYDHLGCQRNTRIAQQPFGHEAMVIGHLKRLSLRMNLGDLLAQVMQERRKAKVTKFLSEQAHRLARSHGQAGHVDGVRNRVRPVDAQVGRRRRWIPRNPGGNAIDDRATALKGETTGGAPIVEHGRPAVAKAPKGLRALVMMFRGQRSPLLRRHHP
jgi:hypothetical protein